MLYDVLTFPTLANRPFYYTNFVQTIDGKIQVTTSKQQQYWPIGSTTDYQTLVELRTYGDILIYGKNTAMSFDHGTNLSNPTFKDARKQKGKDENILYFILCNTPDGLKKEYITGAHAKNTVLVFPENIIISQDLKDSCTILQFGQNTIDLQLLSQWIHKKGLQQVLVEGGPHVLASFLKEDLIDELFLTIAPKIFGNKNNQAMTLVEGYLFPPEDIKNFTIVSQKQVGDEIFLRYRIKRD